MVSVDLTVTLSAQACLGCTGATTDVHGIMNWNFSTPAPAPIQPPPANVVAQNVAETLSLPTAIDWSDDGQSLLVAEKGGVIKVFRDGVQLPTPFIDISDQVDNANDRG